MMLTRSQWVVSPLAEQKDLYQTLGSIDACFAMQGKLCSKGPNSTVTIHEVNGQLLYIKRYWSGGSGLRKYIGRSRVRAEWENLQWFQKNSIQTLGVLAYGEEYRCGKFQRGALVTAQLPEAEDLEKLSRNKSVFLTDRKHFTGIAAQIAAYVRNMHSQGFVHNDLDWRNILVSPSALADDSETPRVYFFDCPGGRQWVWPFLEYRIVKDLSHLDKIARDCLPLRWRLWFYKQYTGRKKLDKADRVRLKKIVRYYEGR